MAAYGYGVGLRAARGGRARADRESVERRGRGGSEGKTGLTMSACPKERADASYSVLEEDKIAQVIFTWNGDEYTFRMAPGTQENLCGNVCGI